jgi:hypothetical protein
MIFKLVQCNIQDQSELANLVLVNKRARLIIRRPLQLELVTEEEARRFCEDASTFASIFQTSLPSITFCDLQVLEILMPMQNSDLLLTFITLFRHVSPCLQRLNICFANQSATGNSFMRSLRGWSAHLKHLKMLKIHYEYQEEENRVCSHPVYTLFLVIVFSRMAALRQLGLHQLGHRVCVNFQVWKS